MTLPISLLILGLIWYCFSDGDSGRSCRSPDPDRWHSACGHDNPAHARYCRICGEPLDG